MHRRIALGALIAALLAGLAAAPAASAQGKLPRPPSPKFVKCSSEQVAFLKDAWWEAYRYVHAADQLLDYIASRPAVERGELWSRDHGSGFVPSPRRYFGPYTSKALGYVREAVDKARRRFIYQGPAGFKGINRLRCRRYCAGNPSAFHFPTQEIATCPKFWKRARNGFVPSDQRRAQGAFTLTHEMFHWLRVNGLYIVDFHTDGAGPHPNRKYYGIDNVTYLAENVQRWAIRNNDTYAFFTQAVKGAPAPTYVGVFADKESSGTGAFFRDMTFSQLVAKQKELEKTQYLADVETYLRGGERRYSGLWRIGSGSGALTAKARNTFLEQFTALKQTQELLDLEVYRDDAGNRTYLGVYRLKPGPLGDSGLFVDMTWEDLVQKWNAFAASAYLADVEAYLDGGKERFAGVWRVGKGTGALLRHSDHGTFDKLKGEQDASQQLIDFERYRTASGAEMRLGVWRVGGPGRELSRDRTVSAFDEFWKSMAATRTMIDVE